jgi:Tfp pilus assembly protein PilF/uncharacterized coiled-coil DUF342 family protein
MRPHAFSLLALFGLAASAAYGQSGDASDQFLNAFLAFQRGEKAELAGNSRSALTAYNQAVGTLDQISARWPSWNPAIVKLRREKALERISKLQPNVATTDRGTARRGTPPPFEEPPLPAGNDSILPPDTFPEPVEPSRTNQRASGDPIQEIQERIDSLQRDLTRTRETLQKVTSEKEELARKYEEAVKEAKATDGQPSPELEKLRREIAAARKALRQTQIERDAEAELNDQLSSVLTASRIRTKEVASERDAARRNSADIPRQIAEMQREIDKVLQEKGAVEAKLGKVEESLAKVTTERDDALAQLAQMREASKNIEKLLVENTQLMARLDQAEQQVAAFKVEGVEKDKQIAALNKELSTTRTQLAEVQKQSAEYQTQMTALREQLDAQAKTLTEAKTDATASAAERKKLAEENEILRGIVLRQQKEQARRDRVKKLVLEQLGKLEVNSKALLDQVQLLGSPVVKLSEKERRLFKEPSLSITDTEITFTTDAADAAASSPGPAEPPTPAPAALDPEAAAEAPSQPALAEATPAPEPAPMKEEPAKSAAPEATPPPVAEAAPAEPSLKLDTGAPLPDALPDLASAKAPTEVAKADLPKMEEPKKAPIEGELPSRESAAPPSEPSGPSVKTTSTPAVPTEIVGLARDAKEQFERGNYREAERIYERALAQAPNNLYVLSNLGVVRFRQQKYKPAIEAFRKAIAIAPEDDFSHCTLGIVHYQMGEMDNAIQALTRALAINPKNATAHNYLGITASQKGWQEAAQKELETAVALDPNYADAHFNLAVVFATQNPPNKENARRHYKRATELGAEPDTALEQLIK